ncbi:hypothetical protein ACFOKI_06660 [Sphingomonas qilianensis]|uniref:Uncharacterized protein n=1 Tax=Sphingomonas qilianensis TaxID=1736690 RepID=A0ABU9XSN0_9SPHN
MTKAALGRRLGLLEQTGAVVLPFALQRWFGEPLSDDQRRLADMEDMATARFVGPPDLSRVDTKALAWLVDRGVRRAGGTVSDPSHLVAGRLLTDGEI